MRMEDFDLFVRRKFIPITRNDKCNCALVSLLPFFEYNDRSKWSEVVHVVANCNMSRLKELIEENKRVRVADRHGNSLLHLSIIFQSMEVFDYLVSAAGVNVNALNRYSQSPLHLAVINTSEYMIMELLKRGSEINLPDECCCIPLHTAASRLDPKMCDVLLDNGANLNFQNLLGKSSLYHACQYGTPEIVYMLLCYGADPTITDVYGILPITAAMQQCLNGDGIPENLQDMHQVLFNYTFEEKKIAVNLTALTVAMRIKSPLYVDILKKVERVKYCKNDLIDLCRCAAFVNQSHFKMLMRQHPYVVGDMLAHLSDLHQKLTLGGEVDGVLVKLMEFMTTIFKHRVGYNFLKRSTQFGYFIKTLGDLFKERRVSLAVFNQMIYFLYSYGLPCDFEHLEVVYECAGFCDLFKFMLDFEMMVIYQRPKSIMPYLIYDINLSVDRFMDYAVRPCKQYAAALKFFSSPKLKDYFMGDSAFRRKVRKLPQIPSLIELSRDVARKYIIEEFKIKTSKELYKLLKGMPINEVYKKILTYERELYRF